MNYKKCMVVDIYAESIVKCHDVNGSNTVCQYKKSDAAYAGASRNHFDWGAGGGVFIESPECAIATPLSLCSFKHE